jgi:hypothetical protein
MLDPMQEPNWQMALRVRFTCGKGPRALYIFTTTSGRSGTSL